MNNIIRAVFCPGEYETTAQRTDGKPFWQWNYGTVLQIHGLNLPAATEIHFKHEKIDGDAVIRIGTAADKITTVAFPEAFLELDGLVTTYVYVSDTQSGQTEYKISTRITARAKPEAWERPEDVEIWRQTVEAVNAAADRAETAATDSETSALKSEASAGQSSSSAGLAAGAASAAAGYATDAEQSKTAAGNILTEIANKQTEVNASADKVSTDRTEVERLAAQVTTDKEQTRSDATQTAADKLQTGLDRQATAGDREQTWLDRIATSADRQAVEQAANGFDSKVQAATTQITVAGTTEVNKVNTAGETQTGNVNAAGAAQVQAVNNAGATQAQAVADEGAVQIQAMRDLAGGYLTLDGPVAAYYRLRRNGKRYQTKIWKFATNPTSAGEKLLDNAGLVFVPSTDTVEGQDDYLNGQHPLFEWVNVNYVRDADTTARPIAIEGDSNYQTSGSVDVGAMQMSFYWNWDTSNAEYDLVTISDTPYPDLIPWAECVKADGTVLPWCIGSKYFSGIASDGLPRSQPGLSPERNKSHDNIITSYAAKGEGYKGAGASRNLFQIIFNIIKGVTKNSQTLFAGCTNYNYQYSAAVERAENDTWFPLTNAQAANIGVGSYVSVGYGEIVTGALSIDRARNSVHQYADSVKVLRIEDLDASNKKVYLDVADGFPTIPVVLSETITAQITLSTMHWLSGATDAVKGHHDGSPASNTSGVYPYRVQGREYAVGGYTIASDTVMIFQSDYSKNVYIAEKGAPHATAETTIKNTYKLVGNFPANATGADFWIGDIAVDETGAWYPSVIGSGSTQGLGDMCYAGGAATSGTREYLQGGTIWSGSSAGPAFLSCWYALSTSNWNYLACD